MSSSSSKTSDLYALAGMKDVAEFYRDRFFTGGVFDARYFDALERFHIRYARTMWVYDNVRPDSSVLDVGCGEGLLALLKRKGVELAGVDISGELLSVARQNGYDLVCQSKLTSLPFSDSSFDYVISLDVLGHISFDEKDAVLSEIKRVLRAGGVSMHGIECLDQTLHQNYAEMSEEKLRRFISVDGHIGLEEDDLIVERFKRFFRYVQAEPRYTLCLSSEEFLKQADEYGVPFERDFLDYLRGLSFNERRAFDMAMGYVFAKISDLGIRLPKSGLYMFLKASDSTLGPFYNEHRDRRLLFSDEALSAQTEEKFCLDRDSRAFFDSGWYPANNLPPVARWMSERARVRFESRSISKLRLDLTTHMPGLNQRPLQLEFFMNGSLISALSLFRYGWLEVEIDIAKLSASEKNVYEFEIHANRTWQPSLSNPENEDDRQLSIAVCNIEVFR